MQGQGLVMQKRQQRQQAAQLRVSAQAATLEAPSRATTSGLAEAGSKLGTQKPTVRPSRACMRSHLAEVDTLPVLCKPGLSQACLKQLEASLLQCNPL